MFDDLEWLGFLDLSCRLAVGESPAKFRQSARGALYQRHLDQLIETGMAYVCACSRRDIAAVGGDAFGEETPYPGTCRDLGLAPGPALGWRVRIDPGEERFEDLQLGIQRQEPAAQCGDILVRDRLGQWTYQFCVVADDMDQDITLVVRGEDLLASTGRQLRLARLLGRNAMPAFLHHPLILKSDGTKLSKGAGDSGVRELREAGVSAAAVREMAEER